jgi:hypothetical protein
MLSNMFVRQVSVVRIQDWLFLGILLLVLLIYLARSRGRRTSVQGRKPGHTDNRARQVLEDAGFSLLEVQPTISVNMEIQGKPHRFDLKSDYLVSRNGRRYLVRVRKDAKPVRLNAKVWRNALLRDVLLFNTYGVLVLNLEKETVSEVHFKY